MQQKLTLKTGIAFRRENDTGVIVDFLPDGETVACVLLTDRDEYKIGTFPESTINDLWNSPRMERISKLDNRCPIVERALM